MLVQRCQGSGNRGMMGYLVDYPLSHYPMIIVLVCNFVPVLYPYQVML